MKWRLYKSVVILLLIVIAGISGFLIGRNVYKRPFHEVLIGHQDIKRPDSVTFDKKFNDVENRVVVDDIILMYINMKPSSDFNGDVNKPDMFIMLNNPKDGVCLINSKVWLTDNGAVIGIANGESDDKIEFSTIDKASAQHLKSLLN